MVVFGGDARAHVFGIHAHQRLHGSHSHLHVEQINEVRVCHVFGDDDLNVFDGFPGAHAEISKAASELRLLDAFCLLPSNNAVGVVFAVHFVLALTTLAAAVVVNPSSVALDRRQAPHIKVAHAIFSEG